jgi:hypothetical protein
MLSALTAAAGIFDYWAHAGKHARVRRVPCKQQPHSGKPWGASLTSPISAFPSHSLSKSCSRSFCRRELTYQQSAPRQSHASPMDCRTECQPRDGHLINAQCHSRHLEDYCLIPLGRSASVCRAPLRLLSNGESKAAVASSATPNRLMPTARVPCHHTMHSERLTNCQAIAHRNSSPLARGAEASGAV